MSERRRIACLLIRDVVTAAELRAHPELAGHPFAVSTGIEGRCEIVATSVEARAYGVRPGQTVAHARAACAELVVHAASLALERTARDSLLDVALSLSPRAALAPRETAPFAMEAAVWLDAAGMTSIFSSEAAFASALRVRAAALGLPGVIAIAGSRFTAHVAARRLATLDGPDGSASAHGAANATSGSDGDALQIQVLPVGADAAFLAAQPIDLLAPDDALAARLTRFGVRFVRDLLALPRKGLARRLGSGALRLAARARGEEIEAPLPEPASSRCEESVDLEYALERAEPLLFVLRGMLSRLFDRLAVRSLAASEIDIELRLDGGGHDARRIGGSAATRDLRVWLRLLALELETRPPQAAVEAITLASEGCPERRDQLDLFLPRGPSPGELDRALAELEALCGHDQVGAPRVADTHRPNSFTIEPFRPATAAAAGAEPGTGSARARRGKTKAASRSEATHASHPHVADGPAPAYRSPHHRSAGSDTPRLPSVRALRPAVPAQVRVEAGTPVSIRSAVTRGAIVHVSGPWRSTGHWWSEEDRYALDHFDVQVSDGAVARLCFDWISRSWSVDALYD